MAKIYALLQPDGSLLAARQKGRDWVVMSELHGVEGKGKNVSVFLNGLDVLGLSANIPARNETQALRAAPFAIEDDLADAVENSHVALRALNKTDPSAPRRINVVSIDAMTGFSEQLDAFGLSEAALIAAHSVLPDTNILFEGPGVLLGRLGDRSFAVDASLGRDVVLSFLDPHPQVQVFGQHLAQAVNRTADGDGANDLEAFLLRLIEWAETGSSGIDLRQAQFAPRRSLELEGLAHWKLAGALAAVTAIAWFGTVLMETGAMNQRSTELGALSTEFARVGWPELGGDVQQVLALTQSTRLSNAQTFPSLLDVSAVLYDALAQVEDSELRTIRYDRLRGQMTATVAFKNFADVDRLTAIVNTSGLQARSGDSRQSGSRVISDLTLESAS
ncbi:MAG: type II secretion system protein GspL [Henriciella sp.]